MKRFFLRSILNATSVTKTPEAIMEGKQAFDKIVELYSNGKYVQALDLIDKINNKYPEFIEATRYYKAKASVKILDEQEKSVPKSKV